MKILTRLIVTSSAAAMLASCGLRGDLERPAPLFGGSSPASTSAEAPADAGNVAEDGLILKQEEEKDDFSDELLGGPDDG